MRAENAMDLGRMETRYAERCTRVISARVKEGLNYPSFKSFVEL